MKISYNLLQTYFTKKLPEPAEVKELFERHLAEVEEMVEVGNDTMIDVNILPDRACYALSHEGIALELSLLIPDNSLTAKKVNDIDAGLALLDAEVTVPELCDRQMFVCIDNVDNAIETPKEIKEVLETLGQRSISFLVDLTNYVMFETGQPLHVFDAGLLKGKISVRSGRVGEKVTTLDNKEVALDSSILTIADEEAPLDIAGIKGGKKAETSKQSTEVILSASHFDSVQIRKTTGKVGIKTDASKRFENNISPTLVPYAVKMFLTLLAKYNKDARQVSIADIDTTDIQAKEINTTLTFLGEKIGVNLDASFVKETLEKMFLEVALDGDEVSIKVPEFRKDLNIPEDIADEVGRLFGYDKLEAKVPKFQSEDKFDPIFVVSNKIRNLLVEKGFSEVYTYSLAEEGEMEIANGLASDKSFMRSQLTAGIEEALTRNVYYADFLAQNKIQIFEIGKVFKKESEYNALAVGIAYKKAGKGQSATEDIKILRDELFTLLSPNLQTVCSIDDSGGLLMCGGKQIGMINNKEGILELNLDEVIKVLPQEEFVPLSYHAQNKYETLSSFPFTTRDVAVFVDGPATKQDEVLGLIKEKARLKLAEGEFARPSQSDGLGNLLVKTYLFDVFEKKNKETGEIEKTSYGARLVFQSFDKTLTDEEVNPIMDAVYAEMKAKGWEVR
jgi:phenylalanyl-tRNA synthetase beta chain